MTVGVRITYILLYKLTDLWPVEQNRQRQQQRSIRVGTLRPDIVLYGEEHRFGEEICGLQNDDVRARPDMLIVMGTSLEVPGVKAMVKSFATAVHSAGSGRMVVFVNKTAPAAAWRDIFNYHVEATTDMWVAWLCRHLKAITKKSDVKSDEGLMELPAKWGGELADKSKFVNQSTFT